MRDHVQYARDLREKAEDRFKNAENTQGKTRSPTNLISDYQESIELATKSMFHCMDERPPAEHEISFENAQGFLRADFPDGFENRDELPKVIFLTRFWRKFYLTAKYGVDEFNIAPSDLFGDPEVELAHDHADFVVRIAKNLWYAVREDQISE